MNTKNFTTFSLLAGVLLCGNVQAAPTHDYLLALSWQPAFCQTHQAKPECASQTADRYDANALALHGLWPQPMNNAYCGVDITMKTIDRHDRWDLLPEVKLSGALEKHLSTVMPGTRSDLERHEWIKHGTCYGKPQEAYFQDVLHLVDAVNDSPVRALFHDNIGQQITAKQIRATFDAAFGAGSGDKVNVRCNPKKMIDELQINLHGTITPDASLGDLLRAAPAVESDCNGGLVDPAGF